MFLPIGDVEPEALDPPLVTYSLIALNVIVYFAIQPALPAVEAISQIPPDIRDFYNSWAIVPAHVARGENLSALGSAMFMHGGLLHLGTNMLYLWIFGNNVEHALGHVRYLLFYIAAGVAGSLLQVASAPASIVWNLGASGAIAGVLAAYMILFPRALVNVLIIFFRITITRVRASAMIGLWFVLQLLSGGSQFLAADGDGGGIAYWAHVGGFVAGLVLLILLGGKASRQQDVVRVDRPEENQP